MAVYLDMVEETTSTTGTGDEIVLTGATAGHAPFSRLTDGDVCYFRIQSGADWEVYLGTYAAGGGTLDRSGGWLSSSLEGGGNMDIAAGATVSLVWPAAQCGPAEAAGAWAERFNEDRTVALTEAEIYFTGAAENRAQARAFTRAEVAATFAASDTQVMFLAGQGTRSETYTAHVVARQIAGEAGTAGDTAGWIVTGTVASDATDVTGESHTVAQIHADTGAAAWDVAVSVSGNAVILSVTGEADKEIHWAMAVSGVRQVLSFG